ncbi:hypothetical protein OSB04_027885 [Centaurea solstitialis]|uniref:Uncharacterized protein n=1 Tax=Centaurea solstitialis TaxID=347529 RepID=A0AA38SEG2_9ASTR|nr:hypothetical protein OSB04_027885 [Centaurea solstitialis]
MKTSKSTTTFLSLLLLLMLLLFSVIGGADAVRIPEHMCQKRIGGKKCDLWKCHHRCAKREPFGVGKCNGNMCICSYYCKLPPI